MWRGLPDFSKEVWRLLIQLLKAAIGLALSVPSLGAVVHAPTELLPQILQWSPSVWFGLYLSVDGVYGAVSDVIRLFTEVQAYMIYGDGVTIRAFTETHTRRLEMPIAFSDLQPSRQEVGGGFACHTDTGFQTDTYMRSGHFDDEIIGMSSWPFREVDSRRNRLFAATTSERRRQIEFLIPRLLQTSFPTINETKWGLRLPDSGRFRDIEIYAVNYIDSLITNEAYRSALYLWDGERRISLRNDLTVEFPIERESDGVVRLRPLAQCGNLGNHIGITLLAVSADHRIVATRQGQMQIGAGSLNLGGSGSLDMADRYNCGRGDDLRATVAYGMARELYGEFGYRPRDLDVRSDREACRRIASLLTVIGYFRWVNRCGKPEFVGVVRLPVPASAGAARTEEVQRFDGHLPPVTRLADFAIVRAALDDLARNQGLAVSTSSTVALERLIEIAGYEGSGDPVRRQIHADLSVRLFPSG